MTDHSSTPSLDQLQCHEVSSTFLEASLKALDKYHPEWDDWDGKDRTKLTRKTIMIPPSYDLLKHFVGPTVNSIDGFDNESFIACKHFIAGDKSEKKLFDAIEKLKAGGILIGGFKFSDVIAKRPHYEMSEQKRNDSSFERRLENDKELFAKIKRSSCKFTICDVFQKLFKANNFNQNRNEISEWKEDNINDKEVDFIYLHPAIGIIIIEVKTNSQTRKANRQLDKAEAMLKNLMIAASDLENVDKYFCGKALYVSDDKKQLKLVGAQCNEFALLTDELIDSTERLKSYFEDNFYHGHQNCFKDGNFRKLIAILIGSRPDIFVSPVKCVLHWNNLIDANEIRPILAKSSKTNNFTADDLTKRYLQVKDRSRTSIQKSSLTANEVLQKYFPKFNPNIKFNLEKHKERTMYFTKEQQNAIVNRSKKLIISGVPGSGKSLILMMRLFIAAQDESRTEIPIEVIAAWRHRSEYNDFLRINKELFRREWWLSSAFATETKPSFLDSNKEFDWFIDEVTPSHLSAYFCSLNRAILVLTSVCEKEHNIEEMIKRWKWRRVTLKTHFRGTKKIAKFWEEYYLRDESKTLIIGHNFDGIPPEFYTFDNIDDCALAMKNRIRQLMEVDGCTRNDYAISFQTAVEMAAIGEMLKDENYQFLLIKGTFSTEFLQDSLIYSLIDNCKTALNKAFKSAACNDAERGSNFHDFRALLIILLEARNWSFCNELLKAKIDESLNFFTADLRNLSDEKNRRNEWEWSDGRRTARINDTILWLNRWKKLLESSSLQCGEISGIERELPIIMPKASKILIGKQNESSAFLKMGEYFLEFRVFNTYPRMFFYHDLPSMQFPIQMVYMNRKREKENSRSLSASYMDFLSVALSRAQSHLIVFEVLQKETSNDESGKIIGSAG